MISFSIQGCHREGTCVPPLLLLLANRVPRARNNLGSLPEGLLRTTCYAFFYQGGRTMENEL